MMEETIMVLDTETANFVNSPIPYDVGYKIINPKTEEVKAIRSFVVYETFNNKDLMDSAYYAKKIPQYKEDLRNGKREMKRITTIRKIVAEDMKKHNCTKVGGYNMNFDKRACNNGLRYNTYSFYRWFFPYGTEFFDIWNMACTSFMRSKHYIKWAVKNGFISTAGNIQTSAEVAYKYITKNLDFVESHTGLEDVEIESKIFFKVLRCKMKYNDAIVGSPWRVVQKYRKEFGL